MIFDCSIVIPTYNSEATIGSCLKSIKANRAKYSYEILVCDAGSTDKTVDVAKEIGAVVLFGYAKQINRNIGIKNAKSKIVLFTDSDCLVPVDWIDRMVDGLTQCSQKYYRAFGIGGGNEPWLENPAPVEASIARAMRSPLIAFKARNTANYKETIEVQHNPPLNSAYYKWVLEKVGGFIEDQGFPEDTDLDARLIEKGYHLYFIKDCVVKHKHKVTYEAFVEQMYNFGKKRIIINRAHPFLSRLYHYAPIVLYCMMYSPLVFIPYGLALVNCLICNDKGIFKPTLLFYKSYGKGELWQIKIS